MDGVTARPALLARQSPRACLLHAERPWCCRPSWPPPHTHRHTTTTTPPAHTTPPDDGLLQYGDSLHVVHALHPDLLLPRNAAAHLAAHGAGDGRKGAQLRGRVVRQQRLGGHGSAAAAALAGLNDRKGGAGQQAGDESLPAGPPASGQRSLK